MTFFLLLGGGLTPLTPHIYATVLEFSYTTTAVKQ